MAACIGVNQGEFGDLEKVVLDNINETMSLLGGGGDESEEGEEA
ncbi:MAG: hypothetical protein QF573_00385 [Chloroflexota bacterium]|nr:hypothetical protein [Chloroflexota bacterium]